MADFTDRVLKCVDCGADFLFTAGEQSFFAEKNFKNDPRRCKTCKGNRKQVTAGSGRRRSDATVACTKCGREARVPFVPAPGRPVYCHECFQQRRATVVGNGD